MRNYLNLKLSKVAAILFAISPLAVSAQFSNPEKDSSKDEETFLYPVRPGQPGSLAGTMGELRTTHFHSGIDIRTDNRIGLAVLASKSGYISRAAMGPNSYGNVIYITHPDGYTTLYAHLNEFTGPLKDYVLNEQYRNKAGEIDLLFHKDQFVVKRGDTIAYSGNSGSSGGPHLHFDIRDENNLALDPVRIARFMEIQDKLPPAAEKIALRTLDINARINDRFGRFEFYAQRSGSNYILSKPILAHGVIGVEILSKDKLANRSPFFGGVNFIEMRVDGNLVFSQAIEKINLEETRGIYTLMDFKAMRTRGTRFYKLFVDDGNSLQFYADSPGNGKIKVSPGKDSTVEIRLKDSSGNSSKVTFKLRYDPPAENVLGLEPLRKDLDYDITENVLALTSKICGGSNNKATIYTGGAAVEKKPDYFNTKQSVYLLDLRKTIPDSIVVCGKSIVPRISVTIPSSSEYKYYSDRMDIQFPVNAAYDTVYLNTDYKKTQLGQEIFTIGSRLVPLSKNISVSLITDKAYPKESGYAVYRSTGGSGFAFIGGQFVNGRMNFMTREFGDYTILRDTEAPIVNMMNLNGYNARFKIRDNLSGISSFKATINGEWILMHYDPKISSIWSERMDKTSVMRGDFVLEVTDNAGNTQVFKQKI